LIFYPLAVVLIIWQRQWRGDSSFLTTSLMMGFIKTSISFFFLVTYLFFFQSKKETVKHGRIISGTFYPQVIKYIKK